MSIVPAHAGTIAVSFPGGPACPRVLIAEGNVLVNEVADGLNPSPAERRSSEQRPRDIRKPVGLAVATAQQENHRFVGQILDGVLRCCDVDDVGFTRIVDDAATRQPDLPGRRNDPAAPVTKPVVITTYRDWRGGDKVIGH